MTDNHNQAIEHLRRDVVLRDVVDSIGEIPWRDPAEIDLFTDLVESIISQQLSVKAADTIYKRFVELLHNKEKLQPEEILSLSTEDMRGCGISYGKIRYIQGLAAVVDSEELNLNTLPQLSDEDVVAELIKLKGIGTWTAEMFLIFSLQRPDVFSLGDLVLRTAVSKLYSVDRDDLEGIKAISLHWKPYRSLASRYLWKSLELKN